MPLRINGSTSGYSQLDAPAIAGDQLFTLPGAGGTLDRINRAGNVLQVVNGSVSINATNSTNVFADTGLTATITPTSASSKILVFVSQVGCGKETGSIDSRIELRLMRGATQICVFEQSAGFTFVSERNYVGSCSTSYLDSPATTASVTYKTQFRNAISVASVMVQGSSAETSTITLMEIAA